MLKKIPKLLSPELVKIMMEMGHGDELVLADANFPGHALHSRVIRCDGLGIPELLAAVLELLPLDHYADHQAALMSVVPGDPTVPVIWDTYKEIISGFDEDAQISHEERFAFYTRSQSAYAIVITGEEALYGNVILKKGVIKSS
ncbi:fucose isomerase [Paenibacillus helianthi]|uniref:Fucose isomerase n=1 Tax=Paenibacillus helianthi TaxID=1349432 RepID=A0ABX3ESA0_9BACL|nr:MULTISPECIES: L-fucose mutarotase [Paenibacillus]OKP66950.1 fucose isomerase [Paenibacillus sp. P3E]OKP90376.1 fucose isomerase [Paenibacillus sp. P32E]OKP90512.1 fucose isomerase [Paenibacillus helianthi]